MADKEAVYVNLIIHDVDVTLPKPAKAFWVLHFEQQKLFSANPPAEKLSKHSWTRQGITIPLTPGQVATDSVRIELFEKGAKLLGGDAFLGEITIPVKRLLLRHAKRAKDGEFPGETVPLIAKDKQRAEVTVWAEASGWAHFLSLLKDKENQQIALEDFKLLALRAQKRDLRKSFEVADQKVVSYIRPDVIAKLLDETKKAAKGKSKSSKSKKDKKDQEPKTKPKIDLLLEVWDNLCKDMRVRAKLAEAGMFDSISEILGLKNQLLSVHFLDCLKHFFGSSGNQKIIIKSGLLDILLQLLTANSPAPVLCKICEAIRYFDPAHIPAIIEKGILRQLRGLMASESNQVLEQVLDTVKFFGLAYKQSMIDEHLAPPILKLVTSSDARVKLKAMDLFDKFKFPHEDYTSSKLASLLDSFKPDDPPMTRVRLLERLEAEAIVTGELVQSAVPEKKKILDILVKCMGDSSSVVQERAAAIVWGMKGVEPKELVEANILKIYADVLSNRKANSVPQNEAMIKITTVFGHDFQSEIEAQGIPAICAATISDTIYDFAVRTKAIDFIATLRDDLFNQLLKKGALKALLKVTQDIPDDKSDQKVPFLFKSLFWMQRTTEGTTEIAASEAADYLESLRANLQSLAKFTKTAVHVNRLTTEDGLPKFCKFATSLINERDIVFSLLEILNNITATNSWSADVKKRLVTSGFVDWAFSIYKKYSDNGTVISGVIKSFDHMVTGDDLTLLPKLKEHGYFDLAKAAFELRKDDQVVCLGAAKVLKAMCQPDERATFGPIILPLKEIFEKYANTLPQDLAQTCSQIFSSLAPIKELEDELNKSGVAGPMMNLVNVTPNADTAAAAAAVVFEMLKKDPTKLEKGSTVWNQFLSLGTRYGFNPRVQKILIELFTIQAKKDIFGLNDQQVTNVLINQMLNVNDLNMTKVALKILHIMSEIDVFRKDNNMMYSLYHRVQAVMTNNRIELETRIQCLEILRNQFKQDQSRQNACSSIQPTFTALITQHSKELVKVDMEKFAEEMAAMEAASAATAPAPADAKTEEKKDEAKTDDKKEGTKAEEKKDDAKTDDKKDEKKDESKTDEKDEKKDESKTDVKKDDAKTDDKKGDTKTDDKKYEAKTDENKDEAKTEEKNDQANSSDEPSEPIKQRRASESKKEFSKFGLMKKPTVEEKFVEKKLDVPTSGDLDQLLAGLDANPSPSEAKKYRKAKQSNRKQPLRRRISGSSSGSDSWSVSMSETESDSTSEELPRKLKRPITRSSSLKSIDSNANNTASFRRRSVSPPPMRNRGQQATPAAASAATAPNLDDSTCESSDESWETSPAPATVPASITPEAHQALLADIRSRLDDVAGGVPPAPPLPVAGATIATRPPATKSVIIDEPKSKPQDSSKTALEEKIVELALEVLHQVFTAPAVLQPYQKTHIWNGLKTGNVLEKLFNSTPTIIANTLTILSRTLPDQSQLGDSSAVAAQMKGAPLRLLKFSREAKVQLRALQVLGVVGSEAVLKEMLDVGAVDVINRATGEVAADSSYILLILEAIYPFSLKMPEVVATSFGKAFEVAFTKFGTTPSVSDKAIECLSPLMLNEKLFLQCIKSESLKKAFSDMLTKPTSDTQSDTKLTKLMRNIGGNSVREIVGDKLNTLVELLIKRISTRADFRIVRDSCFILGELLTNDDEVQAVCLAKNLIDALTNLSINSQHYYGLPLVVTITQHSQALRGELFKKIKAFFTANAYPNINQVTAYLRYLCTLAGTKDAAFKKELFDNKIVDILLQFLGTNKTPNINHCIDGLNTALIFLDSFKGNSGQLKQFRDRVDKCKFDFRYNGYLFFFEYFSHKLYELTTTFVNPTTKVFLGKNTGELIIAADGLGFGCNSASLQSCISNKGVTKGKFYFEIQTRMLPSWATFQVGWCTEAAFANLDPSKRAGVGSVPKTWAICPTAQTLMNEGVSSLYQGQLLYQGNYLQCLIDYDKGTIDWTINGNKLNCGLTGLNFNGEKLFPCVSIDVDAAMKWHFRTTTYVRDHTFKYMEDNL